VLKALELGQRAGQRFGDVVQQGRRGPSGQRGVAEAERFEALKAELAPRGLRRPSRAERVAKSLRRDGKAGIGALFENYPAGGPAHECPS